MKRRVAAVLSVGVGLVLAGCGGDDGNGVADLTVDEILAEAQEALDAADTVNLAGSFEDEGEPFEIDLTYAPEGASGTVTVQGFDVEVLAVDDSHYMRGDADMWNGITGQPGAGQLLADKYVLIPPDAPEFAGFAEFTDLTGLTDGLLVPEGEVTKGDETEINGQAVISLADDDGSTVYIATTGEPLPIQITAPEGETGSLDFDWDVEPEITSPDEAEVVDLSEMM